MPKSLKEYFNGIRSAIRPTKLNDKLGRWASFLGDLGTVRFIEVVGRIGLLALLGSVIVYFFEIGQRERESHYQAWQVINGAQGKGGDGGRTLALRDLSKSGVPLRGVNLDGASLDGLKLAKGANLIRLTARTARVDTASIVRADFTYADFTGARLNFNTFVDCKFIKADFTGAKLHRSDLSRSKFVDSDFSHSFVRFSSLAATTFSPTNLTNASFLAVNFANADFTGLTNLLWLKGVTDFSNVTNWGGITNFLVCNVFGISNPPPGFLEWAEKQPKILKTNITSLIVWSNYVYDNYEWDEFDRPIPRVGQGFPLPFSFANSLWVYVIPVIAALGVMAAVRAWDKRFNR
jgi:hypothetical protein